MVVIYGRILREMVSADATFVYLFTYIKTNTVPLGRCGLWLSVSIKVESQMGQLINRHSLISEYLARMAK